LGGYFIFNPKKKKKISYLHNLFSRTTKIN
jgi:hypothetical protein